MAGTTVNGSALNQNLYATNNSNNNMYGFPTGPSMANDFFGSQAFGNGSIMTYPAGYSQNSGNETSASAVLQSYMNANQGGNVQYGYSRPATFQDYMMAQQIANQFSNNNILISPYDGFHQRDYFAKNNLSIYNQNAQNWAMRQNLSYMC